MSARDETTVEQGGFSSLDRSLMGRALALAREAAAIGEVPVGAVIARRGEVLAEAFNLRETQSDATAHAERLAITQAGHRLGSWRLDDCILYVTLEPCPMCAGAIVMARLPSVIFGAWDPKAGACSSLYQITEDPRLNHRAEVKGGLMSEACGGVLSEFFQARRRPNPNPNLAATAVSDRSEECLSG